MNLIINRSTVYLVTKPKRLVFLGLAALIFTLFAIENINFQTFAKNQIHNSDFQNKIAHSSFSNANIGLALADIQSFK